MVITINDVQKERLGKVFLESGYAAKMVIISPNAVPTTVRVIVDIKPLAIYSFVSILLIFSIVHSVGKMCSFVNDIVPGLNAMVIIFKNGNIVVIQRAVRISMFIVSNKKFPGVLSCFIILIPSYHIPYSLMRLLNAFAITISATEIIFLNRPTAVAKL